MMETPQSTPPAASTPEEPILVLGKEIDFLYPAQTVVSAVEDMARYLGSEGKPPPLPNMPQAHHLCLDELSFFDCLGRRLEPVVDADGTLVDLVVRPDHQLEIRERISQMVINATEKIQRLPEGAALALEKPAIPGNDLSFKDYCDALVAVRLANPAAIANAPCNPWAFLFWQCH